MSDRALVLCFHAVADLSDDPVLSEYGIPEGEFADRIDRLVDRGFAFVRPDQFARALAGEEALPEKAVLLTFDDCYSELPGVVRHVLQPRDISALAFAVTNIPSLSNEWDRAIGTKALDILDSDGLKELASLGVEIGSHTRTHGDLTTQDNAEARTEIVKSREDLAAMGLPAPRFLAYPYGRSDPRITAIAREAGYVGAFGLDPGRAMSGGDHFDLPRVQMLRRDTGLRFWRKTALPWLARKPV